MICDWAARHNMLHKVEVLGFVDGTVSVDWIHDAGGRVINLLSKGSEKHCRYQLKKTLEEHLEDIRRTVSYALERDLEVNLYLEDWSNGMKDSPEYVFGLVDGLLDNMFSVLLTDCLMLELNVLCCLIRWEYSILYK